MKWEIKEVEGTVEQTNTYTPVLNPCMLDIKKHLAFSLDAWWKADNTQKQDVCDFVSWYLRHGGNFAVHNVHLEHVVYEKDCYGGVPEGNGWLLGITSNEEYFLFCHGAQKGGLYAKVYDRDLDVTTDEYDMCMLVNDILSWAYVDIDHDIKVNVMCCYGGMLNDFSFENSEGYTISVHFMNRSKTVAVADIDYTHLSWTFYEADNLVELFYRTR